MKKLIRTLAIVGTLCNMPFAQAGTPADADQRPTRGSITLRTTGETHNEDYAEGDVMVTPKLTTEVGDTELKYTGNFRKATNTDGETTELQTITHKVSADNGTWGLTLGRSSIREFGDASTTVGFDNYMAGKGMTRTFTGAIADYHPLDLTLGIVSSDTTMSPAHWDMLLTSWHHHFAGGWGVQFNIASTKGHVEKAGLALEWHPTDDIRVLADTVYTRSQTSGMLLANLQLAEKIKLFGGAEITVPEHGEKTGKLLAGLEGDLGHGFTATTAVQHDFAEHDDTKLVFGFKFKGDRDLF